jgi:hypothetical protein
MGLSRVCQQGLVRLSSERECRLNFSSYFYFSPLCLSLHHLLLELFVAVVELIESIFELSHAMYLFVTRCPVSFVTNLVQPRNKSFTLRFFKAQSALSDICCEVVM